MVQQVDSMWLDNVLLDFLRTNSRPTIFDIHNYLKLHYNLIAPNAKAYRAWEKAKTLMEESEREQYGKLCNYLKELRLQNLGTTVQLKVDRMSLEDPPKFNRLYIV